MIKAVVWYSLLSALVAAAGFVHQSCSRELYLFMTLGECVNCESGFIQAWQCAKESLPPSKRPRIIAVVRCNRESELAIFRKNYRWTDSLCVDDGNIRRRLGLPANVRVALSIGSELPRVFGNDEFDSLCVKTVKACSSP